MAPVFYRQPKAIPKEMLTIVDRPTIQYIVEEAVASGIEQIILVTSAGKSAIENHFDYDFQLDTILKERNKVLLREELRHISNPDRCNLGTPKGAPGSWPCHSHGAQRGG
ncbi:MAG: hypothetical protein ACOX4Z_00150 [Desulfobulbus sp.]